MIPEQSRKNDNRQRYAEQRGERMVGHVPQGHWKAITFVAALRRHGMTAPQTIDGSMTGKKFLTYVDPSTIYSRRTAPASAATSSASAS